MIKGMKLTRINEIKVHLLRIFFLFRLHLHFSFSFFGWNRFLSLSILYIENHYLNVNLFCWYPLLLFLFRILFFLRKMSISEIISVRIIRICQLFIGVLMHIKRHNQGIRTGYQCIVMTKIVVVQKICERVKSLFFSLARWRNVLYVRTFSLNEK